MKRWIVRAAFTVSIFVLAISVATGQTAKKQTPQPPKPPKATPVESLKVAKGFKVELIYAVPQEQYGSWVNVCVDPKGRLIVSDQYGSLYRVTPPGIQGVKEMQIEKIAANIGEAQGLLWAFDSLYVVVNGNGKRWQSGLYRVTDSNNDDMLDTVTQLKTFAGGGGEHGPHAVIKHPDGKRLTVVCGNQTQMVKYDTTKVPPHWGEDHLLPRMPDGRGFMAGVLGPGGCIYNVDADGKNWELFSTGFRNQFDAAYDRDGNLFTYDADMEWDFNTPWYRPTRVCEVASGSEFGWRNGAGKYPAHYADSVPAILDIGPGSPTGVCFGYGSKFPTKYQNAFYICDWSYGKIYALHLKPSGSAHTAELEEFVTGTPLPLTDIVVNPVDGAMYFMIGGRRTQSALYRITSTNEERGGSADGTPPERKLRAELEAFHGKQDPKAIDAAWPHLNHVDRFIRAAARIAIEHQPVHDWQARALKESDPHRSITALLALIRSSESCPQHRKAGTQRSTMGPAILERLNGIPFEKLSTEQRLELIRTYHVLFNRFGYPPAEERTGTLAKLEPFFPTGDRFVDGELAQVLVYLKSEQAATKLVAALLKAPTQEEQIDYARALRVLANGWTPVLREQYFGWMQKAEGYHGGNSFGGFLAKIKSDAIATLTPQEKVTYAKFITATPGPKVAQPPRKLVKEYKLDDLLPVVEKGMSNRSYENGRAMFAAAQCASCHRFAYEGGISGPDLTQAAGRFSTKDLLTSILDPDKEISDQYANVEIEMDDGRKITGRIVNHNPQGMVVNTNMLDPSAAIVVARDRVESIRNSKISPMPQGTLNTLTETEVLDLMAYILSRGDKKHAMFKK